MPEIAEGIRHLTPAEIEAVAGGSSSTTGAPSATLFPPNGPATPFVSYAALPANTSGQVTVRLGS